MRSIRFRAVLIWSLIIALMCSLSLSVSAVLFEKKGGEDTTVLHARNVLIGDTLLFSDDDFGGADTLSSITITSLPDRACGMLCLGGEQLSEGAVIRTSALNGLRFQTTPTAQAIQTSFTFQPTYASGQQGDQAQFNLHLLSQPNLAPIAEHLSIYTYKNVEVTGYFKATDAEGDPLTFQITSTPARGSVVASDDGSGSFVYTPYENKIGKDSFTYVAIDSAGNRSNPAKVSIRIEKCKSAIYYSDMDGSSAHKAAIRLAEEGLFVGEHVGDEYFFHPDQPISRSQFLAMAMAAADLAPLQEVSMTGFADDASIPVWSKGYVSSALRCGAISGMRDETGQVVFRSEQAITRAEAAAMLNHLLGVSDVAVQTWSAIGIDEDVDSHWALPAAVNLSSAGIMRAQDSTPNALDTTLTRAEAAQLLDNSLDVLSAREHSRWSLW